MPKQTDPDVKRRAVAEVVAGRPVREVAREFGVDPGALSRWRQMTVAMPLTTEYARTRAAMIGQVFDTIYESLDGVRSIARLATDQDWLRQQTAGELAQLAGQLYDRSTRMLHGLQPAVEQVEAEPTIIDAE